MSRREQIRMTDEEIEGFLADGRVVTCATVGPAGRPHLLPLWYVPDGLDVLCWTYRSSQKTANLRRLAEATLQVEDGERYEDLRGVMMECGVKIVEDADAVAEVGLAVARRYTPGLAPGDPVPPELERAAAQQAVKRVALRFSPTRIVSWDHRKLGGVY
ncbi:pyridoxamine 5'-phosphate oxidase family protein [Actinomadura rugatobispora]|uniref:Pyridoxamine 5'-phosphate oxidase family protein n=1 Tax=Actinomadura rugatobispora TaxID=1994 RepID=A0ABW1A3T4_9ACTN|nr:PPOX class F420-dependent oxidoreductase [Actinomadura rugatobispora]